MLVLGRKKEESVIINGNVKVTVSSVCSRTGQVRLAFTAPKNVTIDREEIWLKKNGQEK